MTPRDLTLSAVLAALTAVCAQLSFTLPGISSVPFTLQVFAVVLAGLCLGARRGFVSQLVYPLPGVAGLPVFAQLRGGLSVLVGPTAGYLWAFPLAAAVAGGGGAYGRGFRGATPPGPLADACTLGADLSPVSRAGPGRDGSGTWNRYQVPGASIHYLSPLFDHSWQLQRHYRFPMHA